MTTITLDEQKLRELLKQAVIEALQERQDLWQDAIRDALEDVGLANAILQGRKGDFVDEEEITALLKRQ